jgi:PHD/YefM family antitoxin component YafN of YafNO toxin-antitoxin module
MTEERQRVTSRYAKNYFGQVAGRVGFARERIVITRNNRDFMALVPLEDLELLEKLENERQKRGEKRRERRRTITIDEILGS